MTLDKVLRNETVYIKKVGGESDIKRRFLDLGFIPGETTKCLLISPFKGIKAYLINNNIIAIRDIDSKNIEVSYERN